MRSDHNISTDLIWFGIKLPRWFAEQDRQKEESRKPLRQQSAITIENETSPKPAGNNSRMVVPDEEINRAKTIVDSMKLPASEPDRAA